MYVAYTIRKYTFMATENNRCNSVLSSMEKMLKYMLL